MLVGILVGTICLIGLVRVVARRPHFPGFYRYGGYGHGRHCWPYGFAPGYGRGGGFGRGRLLYGVLDRLDATPSQEKSILGVIDELRTKGRELRGTVRASRGDIARAVSQPTFDASAFDAMGQRIDEAGRTMKEAVGKALAQIHGVLDDRQRKLLGDMIESGWAGFC